jgi:hypothetical protein
MPERARCQAQKCELPVRGDSRMCALHLPQFDYMDLPSREEHATRGWGVWV